MKHEEIYHTCDRCGKKIQPFPAIGFHARHRKLFKMREIHVNPDTYVVNEEINKTNMALENQTTVLEFLSTYNTNINEIELCGDCRKDFEKFMNGVDYGKSKSKN